MGGTEVGGLMVKGMVYRPLDVIVLDEFLLVCRR